MHSNNAICLLRNISVIIGILSTIHLKKCILHFLQYTLLNFQPLFCLSKGYFLCTYILPAHPIYLTTFFGVILGPV